MTHALVDAAVLLLFVSFVSAKPHGVLEGRALTPAGNGTLPNGWNLLGCYLDQGNPRTLNQASYTDGTSMTDEACVSYCRVRGYIYAGVEFSQECYCGNFFATNVSEPLSDCQMPCTGNASEPCGGSSRMNVFWNGTKLAPPINNPGPPGWKFQGCYAEGTNGGRTLTTTMTVPGGGSNMSVMACTTACAGYTYAGTEFAGECYCGNTISNGGYNATITDCEMTCNGNSSEFCGGSGRLDLYMLNASGSSTSSSSGTTSTPGSSITTSPSSSPSSSLTSTSSSTSSLSSSSSPSSSPSSSLTSTSSSTSTPSSSSPASISSTASSSSSSSPTSSPSSTASSSSASSSNPSSSNLSTSSSSITSVVSTTSTSSSATSSATGPSHVPSAGGFTWVGCYSDAIGSRALTAASTINYSTMTVEICASFCARYLYFGVEWSGECYCGNSLQGGSIKELTTDCNYLCDGNQNEYCGGSSRLDLYSGNGSVIITTSASSTTVSGSTTVSSSPTSSTTFPGSTGIPTGWVSDGCWVDNVHGRIVQYEQPDNQQLTVESCISTCAGMNYTVVGLEFGVQCFCGDMIVNAGALAQNQGDCSMQCAGNPSEICGAGNRMSIYHTGNLTTLGLPATQTSGLEGWTYMGCRTDDVNNRTLPWQMILTNNNTAANCLGLCADFGYMAGAMEWTQECYCGDPSDRKASDSVPAPGGEADCSSVCTGNASEICGGPNRISYYEWTGTPPYTFHYPTGNEMGEYQYILNAPVVALITTPGINGKVSFVEKTQTSGTAGSTGAYELDLFYESDPSLAWRTMHVVTDVFCSASITLPDKVGRQLNVGGWNYDSVWGLRLYWPDGSPGVPSTHDWQEDFNEIHLQSARWYPTAMIMANGSVLVIGGETGANGAPSPTLELLPPVGGLVYFDWLDRTDPNNLYPFLCVLPSGGIFVAYWNEARILDPVSFQTIKQLPNMPGSVNNFLSGRTYPLEGTMMLLPQHAPYGDPLIVLICGGAAPGGGGAEAIDNCILTTPDDAAPTWTLERMPSKRVMSCMSALPDGTYLLLNGAKQGNAGFGLGSFPNLQAVLYDPTLPIGQRMSLMATTTIARLYHSEANLLQDGRVIVSGSDPQDARFPEEYRVEVFVPPYLLSGLARPTFSITNKDWTYGESVTISINLPTGNTGGARASLIGATSATHGNSMGQRTLFPGFSCSGATCTITAPPSANIAPPGWYQLFLLDGPTPSVSVFVRIGGDPAKVGNWPQLPDFSVPGI